MDKIRLRLVPQQTTCAWGDVVIKENPLIGGFYVEVPKECQDRIVEVDVES